MRLIKIMSVLAVSLCLVSSLARASLLIPMVATDSKGHEVAIGTIKADDTIYGLLLVPELHGLPPGTHGFHVHQMPMCGEHGKAAGGHLDPGNTNQHRGPYDGNGHLGDMAVLVVDANGKAALPVLAPRLKLEMIKNHTIMIHEGSDNYSDTPEKLGGGGARIACGVVPEF